MGRSRRSKKPEPPRPRLAPEQYSELNATFYTGEPSEYLMMRIESLSLMVASVAALAPAFAENRRVGVADFGPMSPPDEQARRRYIQSEAVIILHHSAETLLRMFLAHVGYEQCPWLGIASSRTPREFKDKCIEITKAGVKRDDVARIFIGGTDPRDAGIRVTDEEFEESVEALTRLLYFCATRFLDESFLYNAAKHGLATVHLDDSTKFVFDNGSLEGPVTFSSGAMLTYLHKQEKPGATSGPEWFVSATGSLPDQGLAVAVLIQRAVGSLWDVARRRYTGASGSITIFSTKVLIDAIYAAVNESLNVVRTISFELPKRAEDGSISEVKINFDGQDLYKDFDHSVDEFRAAFMKRVELPKRQRDMKPLIVSRRNLLPFSPEGSSRV
ncbi:MULTISPECIES: hypothetical protein [unclassified Rhodococcus (in: high G+C Gram-positive bacteria)]|uniref:hypothetical protein n=1 Tax=unclassified Rhodococcus (in: high G+C Gram-positive bacteria) TaxID=192944 RepID=UPI0015C61798|nr:MULTISPECIES: hypothetical protein [unclassified Rhodococcus (in: high G+C Gram-positive bacteria)]